MSRVVPTRAGRAPDPARFAHWRIHFFKRHVGDDPSQSVPARDFLQACPTKVEATILAVVKAVAEAPPPVFSGGGKWEAMHDDLAGFYEVRVDGPQRRHFRLFCVLERDGAAVGLGGPSLVLIAGKTKAFMTVLSKAEYREIRALGVEYRGRNPRNVLR